jgi:hypothetical protein
MTNITEYKCPGCKTTYFSNEYHSCEPMKTKHKLDEIAERLEWERDNQSDHLVHIKVTDVEWMIQELYSKLK